MPAVLLDPSGALRLAKRPKAKIRPPEGGSVERSARYWGRLARSANTLLLQFFFKKKKNDCINLRLPEAVIVSLYNIICVTLSPPKSLSAAGGTVLKTVPIAEGDRPRRATRPIQKDLHPRATVLKTVPPAGPKGTSSPG
jgi:hypothetical protein